MQHRMVVLVALCATFGGARTARAQQPAHVPVELRGLFSVSLFAQDGAFGFGNGQNAQWAAVRSGPSPRLLGGDVRNTRLGLALPGADLENGLRWGGLLEMDFFGGFNGSGPFSDEQPLPRLRLAYAELSHGRTTVRLGQAFTPLFGLMPASVSHVGFPLGFGGAGLIGWRQPGVYLTHELARAAAPVRTRIQLGAFRGSWTGGNPLDHESAGEASGVPQVEARVDVERVAGAVRWAVYAVAHYDRKDLDPASRQDDQLAGSAWQLGGRARAAGITVQGNGYMGRAIGQQFGQATQFGDIGSHGGWLQVGYDISPRLSVWAFQGVEDPSDDDVQRELAASPARLRNDARALMLRYQVGASGVGLEWLAAKTRWSQDAGTRRARQLALSFNFAFVNRVGGPAVVAN